MPALWEKGLPSLLCRVAPADRGRLRGRDDGRRGPLPGETRTERHLAQAQLIAMERQQAAEAEGPPSPASCTTSSRH
ncbi:hypothetical protein LV779_17650 [Streptomyces thinghirensis]|nr:hypothetical protein [Streptomyces thinghirensis]